ncbi:MAG: gamma-glutamylcyclotransferase family protein [Eubacteriales bacterium]|nr:gamma-glutamylcyclotransferase family protein [Eubacteriales bacterium]
MNSRLFAAFGAGLNRTEMAKHCPTAKLIDSAVLKNYRLSFRGSKAGALATIEKARGGSVPTLLWEISPQDEAAIDRWIGVPELYRKATIKVRRDGILVDVLIYILNSGKPQNKPSAFYYSTLLEGYKAAGFDAKILKAAVRNEDPNASGE